MEIHAAKLVAPEGRSFVLLKSFSFVFFERQAVQIQSGGAHEPQGLSGFAVDEFRAQFSRQRRKTIVKREYSSAQSIASL